jgi:hypothetical protein
VLGLEPVGEVVDDGQDAVILGGEDLPLEQVHRLGQAVPLEQPGVVRVVPVLEDLRAVLEPLDEQLALVVGAEVERAHHAVMLARATRSPAFSRSLHELVYHNGWSGPIGRPRSRRVKLSPCTPTSTRRTTR